MMLSRTNVIAAGSAAVTFLSVMVAGHGVAVSATSAAIDAILAATLCASTRRIRRKVSA